MAQCIRKLPKLPGAAAIHKLVVVGDELEGFYEPCVPLQHAFLRLITRPIPSRLRLEHITVLEFEDSCYGVHFLLPLCSAFIDCCLCLILTSTSSTISDTSINVYLLMLCRTPVTAPTLHAEALADSILIALPNLLHLKGKFPLGSAPFFSGLSGLPLLSLTYNCHEHIEDDPEDADWWAYLSSDLQAVGGITSLRSLTLQCPDVESFAWFSNLVHLTKLTWDSDGNPFKDGPGIHQLLSGCQQLQELKAYRLRGVQPPRSQSLRRLYLNYCGHGDIPDVADLPQLSTLHINQMDFWLNISDQSLLQALDRMHRLCSSVPSFSCNRLRVFGEDESTLTPNFITSLQSLTPSLKESVKELWLLYLQLDALQVHRLASAFPCTTFLRINGCSLTVTSLAEAVTSLGRLSKLSVDTREASNDFLEALQGAWDAAQQKQDGMLVINTYPLCQDANQEPMARAVLQRLRAWKDEWCTRAASNMESLGQTSKVSIGLINLHGNAPLGQGEDLV
eukprot:CAMPEP_0202420758 /NCGR_PEP_ID=MMETSP1128-20130828/49985_1 /ASSEMBLY_ACC=CAM_ASM_000463 /TAXON_ID=3047 /ORGANISM="Dunaliella tertiolecta, Strain CCMP1320" /LENGTH=506 /DNA_ID=CAMNT_0049028753 /DNA_START=207 /DNA_END=1725 /DNA_ORIENTATION=-